MHCFLCAFKGIPIAAFLLVFWWVLAGALDLQLLPLAKGTAWAGLCAIHHHDDDGELFVRASAVLKSTLHRAPVGQGPSGPGWLAIAFGFWS